MTSAAAGLVLAACSGGSTPPHQSIRIKPPTTTTSTTAVPAALCPLTGQPVANGGQVPQRPALAVKVDNYPDARPQSGLDKADIIFEEPVEGAITRYAAVFQCQEAPLVGPIRSARNIDIGILGQLGNPIEAHVGGIEPVLANLEASPIVNLDLGQNGGIETHPSGRVAPYDTYSSTTAMWGTHPAMVTPPQPLFSYARAIPTGKSAKSVHIPFSGTSDVTWKYAAAFGVYLRYYNGSTPDVLSDGYQNAASNVVVQFVQISYGPWAENSSGALEVQADLYPDASGFAEVFRDGVEIPGTWHRSTLGSPTQFLNTAGQPIAMQPGQTWVELVPDNIPVTVTP
ncbi:MAG TPA: DUF3048 domain-containing protein [Acidimicrobiales bacterium]|nr:DUF3048 domain-containing protein [Acidimicrobiales bacterium]